MRIFILGLVAVTVWPGSHWISRPLEHQRKPLCAASTRPSCERADWRRYGALGYSTERLVQPLPFRERRIRSTSC